MRKKPKSIAGKFNSEEVEAIEKMCDELDITKNSLIREAVEVWMKGMDVTYHESVTEKKTRGSPIFKRKRGCP